MEIRKVKGNYNKKKNVKKVSCFSNNKRVNTTKLFK